MKIKRSARLFTTPIWAAVLALMAILLVACERPAPTSEAKLDVPTTVPTVALPSNSTATPTIAPTRVLSAATTVPSPTLAATATAKPASTSGAPPTATAPATATVPPTPTRTITGTPTTLKIFLIALDDNGKSGVKVGCGDSAVPVTRAVQQTLGFLRAAITELLSIHERIYGQTGYYNALYQSNLTLESLSLVNGKATIKLTGTTALGGTCDTPRFTEQIRQTALQFSTVTDVEVFINDKPMDQVIGSK
ncbi:MAG: GerMN domain-containing protein [Chloroflexi bacterium]|nr:GerMN domain-containing protein [Chloroflexota bacterium]